MRKIVDVDALLGLHELELKIGGKSYIIKDVKLNAFLEAMRFTAEEGNPEEGAGFKVLHRQLAHILNIDINELEDVGLKSAALAMGAVRDWIIGPEEGEESSSPLT